MGYIGTFLISTALQGQWDPEVLPVIQAPKAPGGLREFRDLREQLEIQVLPEARDLKGLREPQDLPDRRAFRAVRGPRDLRAALEPQDLRDWPA